jgi:hypothetical protein
VKAVNLTTSTVELDPVNGPGLLAPAVPESDGAHERDLVEVTDRERALAEAGTIALEGEATKDRYDGMDRRVLEREATKREVEVTREDGRADLPPTEDDYRRALRLADAGGER